MRTRIKYIAIITMIPFVVLSILNVQAVPLQSSFSILSTGRIEYAPIYSSFRIGIYVSSWNFNEYNVSTIANAFDMSQSWWVGPPPDPNDPTAQMNQVHALNPNYKFLVYRNVMSIYSFWPDEWNYAKSQGWLLKDINGNYVTESWTSNYMVDITNQSYQRWLGARLQLWLNQYPAFDGVMADNALKYSAREFDAGGMTRPINPRTGTYFTDTEILDGCAGILNAVIDAIGTSKLLMPNGIWNGAIWWNTWPGGDNYRYVLSKVPRLNCLASEGAFMANGQWYSESEWKNSIDFVAWVQDNFLSGYNERYFSGSCTSSRLPSGATSEQVIEYGFASMLLSIKYSSPQNNIDFGIDFSQNPNLLRFVQKLRSVDMIQPLGDYYKITSTAVYARDFVNGKVLINPTGVSYTVTLDGSYTTIDNTIVSGSFTVYAHSGVLLVK